MLAGNLLKPEDFRAIPVTALFIAAGVIFPQFFHLIGLGPMFLPMFLPVAVGAGILPLKYALTLGLITPLTSFLLSGMPPIMPPVLPVLMTELAVISLILSIGVYRLQMNVWLILILAVLADRLVLFAFVTLLAPLFGWDFPLFKIALLISGIPGIVLLFAVVPVSVLRLQKRNKK